MYSVTLAVHSLLRWLMLALGATTFVRSLRRWRADEPWSEGDEGIARMLMIAFFLQGVMGYLLYAELSPVTAAAMKNLSGAMKDPQLRFYVAEHPAAMVLAFILVAAGRVRTRAPGAGSRAHRDWLVALLVGGGIALAAVPWPGLAYGRPWFRLP